MYWPGGYGRIGEVLDVTGLEVTRSYRPFAGEPPPLCPQGPSSDCPPVDLEAYAYPSDPSDVALEFVETSYRSPLGSMGAWLVPSPESTRWAIHVHGWAAERREAVRLLPPFHRANITSMVIDYRNDPDTPADPSGHYRFGLTEWEDVAAAVQHALDGGARDVVLVGYSTGAAHVMSFLERSDLAEAIAGIVLDSPNIILAEAVRYGSRDLRFPGGPLKISRLMTEFGMWLADLRWKLDWETTNYVQRVDEILRVPALVFHGTSDHRVPISVSRQLQAQASDRVSLVETPAAGHVMSWNAEPDRYEGYLERFLASL